ncbi:MAG: hypothetical protein KAT18_01660 [Candidatus Latescibacteria bacterium]|nr:hypothetical protein [Candidatus Latescibacterota bacterium]
MRIIEEAISREELKRMAHAGFGDMIKAVVDVERGIMVLDGELHADEEALLMEGGSRQSDLWGINIYPDIDGPDQIEFDSMVNIRPMQGNQTRGVDDPSTRNRILQIIKKLVSS